MNSVLAKITLSHQYPDTSSAHAVDGLIREVFEVAAGQNAVHAVSVFLRSQRVTQLVDLQFLQLPWLQEALQPLGLPPLLLNKFLSLAHQRLGLPSPHQPSPASQ